MSRRRESAVAGLVLAAVLTAVHYDVVFQGRSLVLNNHSNPLDYRFLPPNYGPDLVPPETWFDRNLLPYANVSDPGATWWQWEPGGELLEHSLRRGELPLWDPYVGGGTPGMANLVSAYFFPPHFVLVATVGHSARIDNVYLFITLWATAFFGYLFLRAHQLRFGAALAGGVGLIFSGAVNQYFDSIMGQSAMCLTPVLYVTRRLLDAPTRWRVLLLALTYAGAALASFPPVLVSVFALAALYAVVAVALGDIAGRQRPRALAVWAGGTALAVGLVGFYYVPAAELTALPQMRQAYAEAGLESVPASRTLQLLSPTLAGGAPIYARWPLPTDAHLPYAGAVVLLLALLAAGRWRGRQRTLAVFALSGLTLIGMKLFGVPPVHWLGHVPGLAFIHFAHYLGIVLGYVIALLAALGVERLLDGRVGRGALGLAIVLAVLVVEALWRLGERSIAADPVAYGFWLRDWRLLAIVSTTALIGLTFAALTPRHTPPRRVGLTLLALAAALEGFANNAYPSPRLWDVFDSPPPFMAYLRDHAGLRRVMTYGAPNANLNEAFAVSTFDSVMAFNPSRAHALFMRYGKAPDAAFMRESTAIPPDLVLDREGIGLLSIRNDFPLLVAEASARGYRRVLDDGYVSVFERDGSPRAYFSSDYRVLPAAEQLEAMATAPAREILVETAPPSADVPNLPSDPQVRVREYALNRVVVEVDAPRPGLVYLADNLFDGWTASIDGEAAPILYANYAFRAVTVPAGPVTVTFRYWPPGLTAGLVLSALSACLLAGIVMAPNVRGRPMWALRRRPSRRAGEAS